MKRAVLICMLALLAFSCEKKEVGDGNAYEIKGYVQKGPFIQGSDVRIQELSSSLIATGKSFFTETNDDFGSFALNIEVESSIIDIATTGFYFNEVDGRLSNSYITLRAISFLGIATELNVNILTTLAYDRTKHLITNDRYSFVEARKKAQKEVLGIFHIEVTDSLVTSFEEMDISKSGFSNSILLAISSILQYGNSEAELSELINKFSADIKEDGILNNETIKSAIRTNSMNLNVGLIIENLENRYKELGLQISIPDFGNYIDKDGDGFIDLYQAPTPEISPVPEMISMQPLFLTISTETEAEIYYTTDGTDPDRSSIRYIEPFQIGLDGKTVTVKAIAYFEGLKPSAISSHTYSFKYQKAFSPKYSIMAGTYNHDLNLELYSEADDVDIYYSNDGSIPDINSTKYIAPIPISGNNTVFNIKAIAIHQYLEQSFVSKSYYEIDYAYNEKEFIDNLTVEEYNNKLVGKWVGHVSTPWTGPYNIEMEIYNNGNYSAKSLSAYKYPYGSEVLYPAFYYGTDSDSEKKIIEINDLYANGKARGEIIIVFDPNSTNTGVLKNVALSNDFNNLQFLFWHRGQYGPLIYKLTRL